MVILIVLVAVLGLATYLIIGATQEEDGFTSENYFFSFEDDLQNWTDNGTDLDNPPVDWSIDVSQDLASHGESSAKFYLSNLNDAGKIWLERSFEVHPGEVYQVFVSYDFVSKDYGDINLWKIITGVHNTPPRNADELVFQGNTGNGADSEVGYKWMSKDYDFTIESDPEGEIYVTIGVWGTWETAREYFVDNVKIEFDEI